MLDYLNWFLFSVIVSLFHLVIAKIILRVFAKAVSFEEVLREGSLVFFAICLCATSFSDFIISDVDVSKFWTTLAVFGVFTIWMTSIAAYSAIILNRFVIADEKECIDSSFIYSLSWSTCFSAVAYGTALFFVLRYAG